MTKIALVTGGSRGLGKDMALALAKKRIDVVLTYRTNKKEAEEVVAAITQSGRKAMARFVRSSGRCLPRPSPTIHAHAPARSARRRRRTVRHCSG